MNLNFDQRFFRFDKCIYKKNANNIVLVFLCRDNYESEIAYLERSVSKQLIEMLDENVKIEFEYEPDTNCERVTIGSQTDNKTLREQLEELNESFDISPRYLPSDSPDKTLKISEPEYLLGKPVNMRPVKIKYIRVSGDEQVTAGTIFMLKKREYKRTDKESGEEVVKPYWTFMLDDTESQIGCVFFPSQRTLTKFEKLVERTVVCVTGICENFRDQKNFRVSGISLCEFVPLY